MVWVNTNATDWCCGTIASTTTTTATPAMCHQAEIGVEQGQQVDVQQVQRDVSAMITVKTRKIVDVSVLTTFGNHRFSSAVVKVAAP